MDPSGGGGGGGFGEVDPGTMGQMDSGAPVTQGSGFEEEPPLLEELGINFDLIKQKVSCRSTPVCVCVQVVIEFEVMYIHLRCTCM